MIIYLYVKTHNKTGLKYLGKTTASDPHKYLGSGTYWKNHLRVHGKDHSTTILKECQSELEVKEWGQHYSTLWNVVNSSDWANLKPETGEGGTTPTRSVETKKKISVANKGNSNRTGKKRPHSEETKQKISEAKRANPISRAGYKHSDSTKEKISAANKNKRTGRTLSDETKAKIAASLKGKESPRKGVPSGRKGIRLSEEHKQKLKEGRARRARQSKT